jgi:hypothetical protein
MIAPFALHSRRDGMAVAFQLVFKGATLDQYDQVIHGMGLTRGGETPAGALFHWVTRTDDGIMVVDVWETPEQFEQFSREQIGPLTQQAGITEQPEVTAYPVHNWLGASRAES